MNHAELVAQLMQDIRDGASMQMIEGFIAQGLADPEAVAAYADAKRRLEANDFFANMPAEQLREAQPRGDPYSDDYYRAMLQMGHSDYTGRTEYQVITERDRVTLPAALPTEDLYA